MNAGRIIMVGCFFISGVLVAFPLKSDIMRVCNTESQLYGVCIAFMICLSACIISILFSSIKDYFSLAGATACAITTQIIPILVALKIGYV